MIMMSTATPVQSGDVRAKRPLRTGPIDRGYTTIPEGGDQQLAFKAKAQPSQQSGTVNNKPAAIAKFATSRAMGVFKARQFRICLRPVGGPNAQSPSPAGRHP